MFGNSFISEFKSSDSLYRVRILKGNNQQMQAVAKFREYPSIELHTRGNFVDLIKAKYADPKYLWVASEKIHGSNFSVYCDGHIVKYGRRNDFITKEIPIKEEKMEGYFQESFYDAKNLVLKFHSKLGDLFEDLKKKYPDIISYTLYGEYFGGNWIKKDMAKQKAVQTGITYTPFHEYMVFDVTVKTPGGDVWVPATEIEGFVGKYIKTVPVYCKGTFDEVFNVNTKIDSTIPPLLGLEKVEKNLIEGMVLRPNETFFEEDQRIMLKKKNAEFQEKAPVEPAAKKAGKKEEKELPPEIAAPVDFLSAYLNKNRVESVLSKFPDVKDRNKLKKEIYDDMIKDAEKDEFKKPEGDLLKKVTAQVDKRIIKALNDYFAGH